MKILLLILGIVLIAACVLSLLYSGLNLFGYHNVIDGSPGLYKRLHKKAVIFAVSGGVIAVAGAVCFIIRAKL